MKTNKEYNNRICVRINDSDFLKLNHILHEKKELTKTKLLRNIISKEINNVYYTDIVNQEKNNAQA